MYPAQDHLYIDPCCPFWMDVAYGVPDWFKSPMLIGPQAIYPYTKEKAIYQCSLIKVGRPFRDYTARTQLCLQWFRGSPEHGGNTRALRYVQLWDYRYLTSFAVANPVPSVMHGGPVGAPSGSIQYSLFRRTR